MQLIRGTFMLAALLAAAHAGPGLTQTSAVAPPGAVHESKQCESAKKKIDREQKSVTAASESIAKDRRARETCATRSTCSRYDDSITAMERRKSRHEARQNRFRDEAVEACRAG